MNGVLDWSAINTALLLGSLAYIWRQSRIVDQLRQALVGMGNGNGGGLIGEMKMLRERTYDLTQKLTVLSVTVEELTHTMEARGRRRGE